MISSAAPSPALSEPVDDLPSTPIVLGVSGHMDIRPEDHDALRAALAAIFEDFRARYPHTPLVLLSALARGSDQLAAEVARACNVQVRAPLPFPAEVYAASSTFADHPADGTTLLAWVRDGQTESFVVPMPGGPASDDLSGWQTLAAHDESRHAAYANVGGYVVRHCHALIAFWDGRLSGQPSGTEEIVLCKLEGLPPKCYPHRKPLLLGAENGPVFVVHAPRRESTPAAGDPPPGETRVLVPAADGQPVSARERRWRVNHRHRLWARFIESFGSHHKAPPGRAEWRQFHQTCQSVDDFNRDVARHGVGVRRQLAAALPRQTVWQQADRIGPVAAMRRLVRLRETAAVLARLTNPTFDAWQVGLFVLLFLSVLSFHLYAHLESAGHAHLPWLLWSFVLLLLGCSLIIGWVWLRRTSERRLDYRALAEVLRVRIFWGAAGVGESVADSYFGQMRSEMAWARRALQSAAPPSETWQEFFGRLTDVERRERLAWVCADWVEPQTEYFKKNCRRDHGKALRLRRWGFVAAVAGWGLAAALLVVSIYYPRAAAEPDPWWIIASGTLVLLGGLLVAYCERCAYEETGKQYERMHTVFYQGRREIERHLAAGELDAARGVMAALGREAITENVQWLILRRSRPFELLIH